MPQPPLLQKLALVYMTSHTQKVRIRVPWAPKHLIPCNLPITEGNWPEKSYPSSWRVVPQLPILQRGRDFLAIRSSCPWPVPTWPAGCHCLCRRAWPVSQSLHDLLWRQDSPYPFGQKKAKSFIKVIIFCNPFGVVRFRFFFFCTFCLIWTEPQVCSSVSP